jgi:VCBS repeat-containing protein
MTLQEILKAKGLTDEQIESTIGEMKQNKIFTASEENLDTRYGKLKADHDGVTKQLTEANTLIEQLKKGNSDNETLQTKITDYESKVATLTAENEKLKIDGALKVALLDAGAKASDLDYLMFKAGAGDKDLKIGDDGKLKGQEDLISGLKTQFPNNFATTEQKQIQEHKLEKGADNQTKTVTAEDFAKMGYQDRLKLFKEQPDTYAELTGKKAQ